MRKEKPRARGLGIELDSPILFNVKINPFQEAFFLWGDRGYIIVEARDQHASGGIKK